MNIITVANSKLTMHLEASQAYIKKLKEDITDFKVKMNPVRQGHIPAKIRSNNNYCKSHGYQVHKDYTSVTFKAKKDGHKTEAMKSNRMDGVKWGKELCRGAAEVIDYKLDQFALALDCTPSLLTPGFSQADIDHHLEKLQHVRELNSSCLQCMCRLYIYLRDGASTGWCALHLLEPRVESLVPMER
jgi:hypothetical protein